MGIRRARSGGPHGPPRSVLGSPYALWSPRLRHPAASASRSAAASAIGCESLQIFTHNPRTWRPINHTDAEIAAFREEAAAAGIGPIVSHGLYLMNLGAPDRDVPSGPPGKAATSTRNIYRLSVTSLTQHLEIGERLGLAGVVLHVGSSKGSTLDEAIDRIAAGIAEAFAAAPGAVPGLPREHRRAPATPSAARSPSSSTSGTASGTRSASAYAWIPSTCSPAATRSTSPAASIAVLEDFDTDAWGSISFDACTSTTR